MSSDSTALFDTLTQEIKNHAVVLFMKGTKAMPQCGFSGMVVQTLNRLQVDFKDINVLEDFDLREAIKKYSDWPTIPQLYIKGEFIGGADIVREMMESGELVALLKDHDIPYTA